MPESLYKQMRRKHICICICTYKRPEILGQLLKHLSGQNTEGLFSYSIVVADNDHVQSARSVVHEFAAESSISVSYCVEPQQSIALARNKAVSTATGDFIAFIDDDEVPSPDWLRLLFEAIESYGADGVLAPVLPRFLTPPPEWIR